MFVYVMLGRNTGIVFEVVIAAPGEDKFRVLADWLAHFNAKTGRHPLAEEDVTMDCAIVRDIADIRAETRRAA